MASWPNIDAHLDGEGIPHGAPTWVQTEGGTHSATSLHYQGRARDYGNLDTPGGNAGCNDIYRDLVRYASGPGYILQELFWNPIGCWQRGNPIGPVAGHWDHVHAGLALGKFLPVKAKPEPEQPKPIYGEEEFTLQ